MAYLSVLIKEVGLFLLWCWGQSISWIIDPQLMGGKKKKNHHTPITNNANPHILFKQSILNKKYQDRVLCYDEQHHSWIHKHWCKVEFEPGRLWLLVKVSPSLWTWKPYQSLRRLTILFMICTMKIHNIYVFKDEVNIYGIMELKHKTDFSQTMEMLRMWGDYYKMLNHL